MKYTVQIPLYFRQAHSAGLHLSTGYAFFFLVIVLLQAILVCITLLLASL